MCVEYWHTSSYINESKRRRETETTKTREAQPVLERIQTRATKRRRPQPSPQLRREGKWQDATAGRPAHTPRVHAWPGPQGQRRLVHSLWTHPFTRLGNLYHTKCGPEAYLNLSALVYKFRNIPSTCWKEQPRRVGVHPSLAFSGLHTKARCETLSCAAGHGQVQHWSPVLEEGAAAQAPNTDAETETSVWESGSRHQPAVAPGKTPSGPFPPSAPCLSSASGSGSLCSLQVKDASSFQRETVKTASPSLGVQKAAALTLLGQKQDFLGATPLLGIIISGSSSHPLQWSSVLDASFVFKSHRDLPCAFENFNFVSLATHFDIWYL